MPSILDGTADDVLTILGARTPTDVQVRRTQGSWARYAFEAALTSAPDHVLPIDRLTADVLLARGARPA